MNKKFRITILSIAMVINILTFSGCKESDAAMTSYLTSYRNLPLIEHSDWINVKTDIVPAAVGDGIADDTAALKAAFDRLGDKKASSHILYFPPGTYRITDTLTLTKIQGGALYGHGGATKIVWDGKKGGRMFHSNGFGRSLWYGLSLDGAGKAAVGVDHDSKTYYETRVRHQYCTFRNFTDSGIRVGHDQKVASAEMMFYDCAFEDCERGISTLAFNDYDNSVARCIFKHCGTGIYCYRGNFYIRDSHFEGSTKQDILLPPHSHSIRRCTSVGSHAFVRPAQPGRFTLNLAIQDCLVSGWTSPTGAVQIANAGPVLLFDTVFESPADPSSPAIYLNNRAGSVKQISLVLANVDFRGLQEPVVQDHDGNRITTVPREGHPCLMETSAALRWKHRPVLPAKVFDVVRDFGADPSGRSDAAAAIQRAINAARADDELSEVYLPEGTYRLGKTLEVKPGNYQVGGGIAWRTRLLATEAGPTVMMRAHNADGVTLKNLRFEAPKDIDITGLLVTANRPGDIILDGIWSGGSYKPRFKGTRLENLPKGFRVASPHLDGELTIHECGDATILLDYWFTGYAGPLTVSGETGSGFLGIHSAAGALCDPDITIRDSSSVVIGDFYTEQTERSLYAAGEPGQTPGRVTISFAKQAAREPNIVEMDGYVGQVTVSRASMMYRPSDGNKHNVRDAQGRLPLKGADGSVFLLLGNSFRFKEPSYDTDNTRLIKLGNNVWVAGDSSALRSVKDTPLDQAAIDAVNLALDHFRELSKVSLNW